MLKEFDPLAAPNEEVLIRCFREGLRPSIQAQMDSRHRELDSWDEVLDKAIEAESKAALQSATSIREMDARCWKGRRPDKETSKPQKEEKTKPADNQPTTSAGNNHPASRNPRRNRGNRRDRRSGCAAAGTPATGANSIDTNNNSGADRNRPPKDLSQITCWNCNQKGHYATKCPQPPKPKN